MEVLPGTVSAVRRLIYRLFQEHNIPKGSKKALYVVFQEHYITDFII